jgi:hypothetical protein
VDNPTVGDWQYVTCVYVEPADEVPAGYAPCSLNLTAADNAGQSFSAWQRATDLALPDLLNDYVPIDAERVDIAGHHGGRRLGHCRGPEGEPITIEQWFVVIEGTGHTLTFTVDTRRYSALADTLTDCAATWVPDPELTP